MNGGNFAIVIFGALLASLQVAVFWILTDLRDRIARIERRLMVRVEV